MADIHLKVTIGGVNPLFAHMAERDAIEAVTGMIDSWNQTFGLEGDRKIECAIVAGPAASESELIELLGPLTFAVDTIGDHYPPEAIINPPFSYGNVCRIAELIGHEST